MLVAASDARCFSGWCRVRLRGALGVFCRDPGCPFASPKRGIDTRGLGYPWRRYPYLLYGSACQLVHKIRGDNPGLSGREFAVLANQVFAKLDLASKFRRGAGRSPPATVTAQQRAAGPGQADPGRGRRDGPANGSAGGVEQASRRDGGMARHPRQGTVPAVESASADRDPSRPFDPAGPVETAPGAVGHLPNEARDPERRLWNLGDLDGSPAIGATIRTDSLGICHRYGPLLGYGGMHPSRWVDCTARGRVAGQPFSPPTGPTYSCCHPGGRRADRRPAEPSPPRRPPP